MNNYRICFSKTHKMIFIGHLDLLKFFQRAVKRGGIPIEYSKGFNPHQIMCFAQPLPLGTEGLKEYLDIRLTENMDCEDIKTKLKNVMTEGLDILEVRKLEEGEKNCASAVRAAVYDITLQDNVENLTDVRDKMENTPQWLVEKKGKKAVKQVDIRPLVYSFDVEDSSKLRICIATGSESNLKPELFLAYFYNIMGKEYFPLKNNVVRVCLLKDGERGFQGL